MKKYLSIFLCFAVILSVCSILPFSASAEESDLTEVAAETSISQTSYNLLSENEFISKINELKAMYPANSAPDYTYYEGGSARAWTCHGFANKLAFHCFGSSIYTSGGGWSQSWDSSSFNAGDIVRINGDSHTIFITYASGGTIKYAEGNYNGIVRWDVQTSISGLQGVFTYKYHLSGNNLTGTGEHIHNYSTYVYYWKSHPHYNCYRCSCGEDKENRNEPNYIADCPDCNHTVRYDANGGSGAPEAQTKKYLSPLALSERIPVRDGYRFLGWATDIAADTPDYQPGASYESDASLTLYAVWIYDGYTIKYDANGGEGAPESQLFPFGESITLSDQEPTREGYLFSGWSPFRLPGEDVDFSFKPAYVMDPDELQLLVNSDNVLTFYAIWTPLPERIILSSDQRTATAGGSPFVLTADIYPENAVKTVVWSSDNDSVVTIDSNGMCTAISRGYAVITGKTINDLEAHCVILVSGSGTYVVGDTDKDNIVTILDATAIQRKLADLETKAYDPTAADADEDGQVSILDATEIQRYLASLPTNDHIAQQIDDSGSAPEISDWSDWSPDDPQDENVILVESCTEYRYKDAKTIKALSQPETPEGFSYTTSQKSGEYTDWGAWSGWSTSKQDADGTLKQEDTTTGYRYYAFVCPNCGQRDPYKGGCSKCGYNLDSQHWNETYYPSIGSDIHAGNWDNSRGFAYIDGVMWTYEFPGAGNGAGGTGQPTVTMYRYRTRSEYTNYEYIQDEYSSWQKEKVTESETRTVETRTVYRYKSLI